MVSFESDYNNGAHPSVLEAFLRTNDEQTSSYGADRFSESAREKIRLASGCPDADVYFLAGGTQTNATVIGTMLQPYEGVIAVKSGHIAVHEAGAIEFTGHKVLQMDGREGKMVPSDLKKFILSIENEPSADHCVYAGMVYITFPSEQGTIYSASEIAGIYDICKAHGLLLYVDGARLGYGLAASALTSDPVTLPFLAAHCDCFYIGGTKVGALCGEAIVFPRGNAPKHFFTMVKQRGALLAKSRVVGVQFDALFEGGLYFEIARNAIKHAVSLRALFESKGIEFAWDSPTNQIFVVLEDAKAEDITARGVLFEKWEPAGDAKSVYRFVTSWATKDSDICALEAAL